MLNRIFRKTLSLAAGVTMASAALTGALAYDLSTYPAKFIVNGNFDGTIVLGEHASVEDVLGAIDITASLQLNSVTNTVPAYHGVLLNGDAKGISGGKVQLRKSASGTFTANDIKAFKRGHITNSRGATDYDQFLRVGKFGNTVQQNITSNYVENDDSKLADYLVLGSTQPFFEWEIRFLNGFESERKSDGSLKDYEDQTIGLVGNDATIVSSSIAADGTDFTMTLMGGNAGDTLREGETKTYTINGKEYEVTLAFISDPNAGTAQVKFVVNGEMTQALEKGGTDTISDGTQIGVREILVNARQGVASFYLGARKIVISDATPSTENFDGTVEVNNKNIPEGAFQVMGNFDAVNSSFRLAWMKYRYTANPLSGSTLFLPADQLMRGWLNRPEGMLSDIDFHYHGLLPAETRNLSIRKQSDDRYRMTFSNVDGTQYTFPLLSNKDGVWKYGDDNDDLVFAEGANAATPNVGIRDYFVLTNSQTGNSADKSVTHVLRYTDYDAASLTLTFERQSDHSVIQVPVSRDGIGYLVPGAQTYLVNVSDVTAKDPNLSIDLDASNTITGIGVKVVTWGGLIVNLAQAVVLNSTTNGTLSSNLALFNGNGKTISGADPAFTAGDGRVQMSGQILAKKFDTPATSGGDETFNWTVTQASNNQVDITMGNNEYDGPVNSDFSDDNTGFVFTDLSGDTDRSRGLTDWGILIEKYSPSDHPSDFTLNIPLVMRYTQMYVSVGEIIHGVGTVPGTTTKINPIAVGIAALDKDAPALDADNLIVVGGPCVNTVAAALLGNPANCADGFEQGKATIQSFENKDKVAVLVAGYDATGTLGASRVLAKYSSYKLFSDNMVVTVSDLGNITVKPK